VESAWVKATSGLVEPAASCFVGSYLYCIVFRWPSEVRGWQVGVRQVSIFLENRAGRVAELVGLLSARGFAISGFSLSETADYGIVRLLTDRGDEAAGALRDGGFTTIESEVLLVDVRTDAGALAGVLRLLADASVDIEYLYLTADGGLAAKVDDLPRVESLLVKRGYRPVHGGKPPA
jgi:hypothetical protein